MTKRIYGVFQVEQCWKLYSQYETSRSFACRKTAVAAGESVARGVLAQGIDVELYIEDEKGHFYCAPTAALGH